MPNLIRPTDRFSKPLEIIEGGSGKFKGVMDEPPQGMVAAYAFTEPRRLLRMRPDQRIPVGCVIKDAMENTFIVAEQGASVDVFKSYRLFDTTGRYKWERRTTVVESITGLETDEIINQDMGMIWGVLEPQPEQFDRQIRSSFEISRFITNKGIQTNDIINGERVTRVDNLLGVYLISLG